VHNEWDYEKIMDWGLDIPETFKLTEIKNNGYDSMYYTPEKLPKLKLNECLDLMLFNKKNVILTLKRKKHLINFGMK